MSFRNIGNQLATQLASKMDHTLADAYARYYPYLPNEERLTGIFLDRIQNEFESLQLSNHRWKTLHFSQSQEKVIGADFGVILWYINKTATKEKLFIAQAKKVGPRGGGVNHNELINQSRNMNSTTIDSYIFCYFPLDLIIFPTKEYLKQKPKNLNAKNYIVKYNTFSFFKKFFECHIGTKLNTKVDEAHISPRMSIEMSRAQLLTRMQFLSKDLSVANLMLLNQVEENCSTPIWWNE